MAERAKVAKVTYPEADAGAINFHFTGDEAPIVVNLADFNEETKARLMRHGLRQKLGDSYAGSKGVVEDAKKSFGEVLDGLRQGLWTTRSEGTGAPKTSQLAEALARVTGKSLDEAKIAISKLAEADEADEGKRVSELRKHPQIALELAKIRVERATDAAAKAGEAGAAPLSI